MEFFQACCFHRSNRAIIVSLNTTIPIIPTRVSRFSNLSKIFRLVQNPFFSSHAISQDIAAQISPPSIDPRFSRHALDEAQFHIPRTRPSPPLSLSREIRRYNGHSRNQRLCV